MKKNKHSKFAGFFDKISCRVTKATGSPAAFLIALLTVTIWAGSGPIFQFSETWQFVINTGTTVITFLTVFIIQQAQNKDTVAIHLNLNELITAAKGACNRMIDVEDLTADELETVKKYYIKLYELAEKEKGLRKTHTIDEGIENNNVKLHTEKNN